LLSVNLHIEASSEKGQSPIGSEEDQLAASLVMSASRRDPLSRKRQIPPSVGKQKATPTTLSAEPLFLPKPDEQGPSTSVEVPLFLPEERDGERPKKKKRRISSKVTQNKTLNDLWHSRQVSDLSLIFDSGILITLGHDLYRTLVHLLLVH
jgi:hypothetical protein